MKKVIICVIAGVLVIGANICAASGDLIVNGNVGIGTTSSVGKLHVLDSNGGFFFAGNTTYNRFKSTAVAASTGKDLLFSSQDAGDTPDLYIKSNGNVGIGTTSPAYKLDVRGQVASNGVVLTSDAKFKKNLLSITDSLNKVIKLSGVSYEWKTDGYKDESFPGGRHHGLLAQDVEKVFPDMVSTASDGTKGVAYLEIIPVLIEAIKEQQKKIERLEKILSDKK